MQVISSRLGNSIAGYFFVLQTECFKKFVSRLLEQIGEGTRSKTASNMKQKKYRLGSLTLSFSF